MDKLQIVSAEQNYYDVINYYYVLYVFPVIIVFGVCGNVTSFIVMTSKKIRNQSTSIFLAGLAVSDTVCLLYFTASYWYGDVINHLFFMRNYFLTRMEMFWLRFPSLTSWYLVVAVGTERFVVTWFPLHAASICRPRRALVTVVTIATVTFTYALVVSVLPSVASQRVEVEGEEEPESRVMTSLMIIADLLLVALSGGILVRLRCRAGGVSPGVDKVSARATVIVLTVCLAFLLLTGPSSVLFALYSVLVERGASVPEKNLVESVCVSAFILNNSLNFVLYTLCSSRFRAVLAGMFRGRDAEPLNTHARNRHHPEETKSSRSQND